MTGVGAAAPAPPGGTSAPGDDSGAGLGKAFAVIDAGRARAGCGISTLTWGKGSRNRASRQPSGKCAMEDHMAATAQTGFPVIREAVASFPDRAHFRRAVSAL